MELKVGEKVKVSDGSGVESGKTGTIIDPKEVKLNDKGVPELPGHYKPIDWKKEYAIKLDKGDTITMFKNRVVKSEAALIIETLAELVSIKTKRMPVKKAELIAALKKVIATDVDETTARELELYIDNDASLYEKYTIPIYKNLTKKMQKKEYDRTLADKAFSHLVDLGAKNYAKEFSTPGDWNKIFSPGTRKELAKRMVKVFEDAYENKEYDFMDEKK